MILVVWFVLFYWVWGVWDWVMCLCVSFFFSFLSVVVVRYVRITILFRKLSTALVCYKIVWKLYVSNPKKPA